jgi:hypothetical protein
MMLFSAVLLASTERPLKVTVEPAGGTVGFAATDLKSGRLLDLKQDKLFPYV